MTLFNIIWKRFLSYKKSSWDFGDYPVRTWKNPNAGEMKVAYGAGISNWALMVGHGESREKAVQALKISFELFKANDETLPRPGIKVPIKFASTEKISKYEDIAIDYFEKVLNMNYREGFYSDGSSLINFTPAHEEQAEKLKNEIIKKTIDNYGVDISDVFDGPLYDVLEKIEKRDNKTKNLD